MATSQQARGHGQDGLALGVTEAQSGGTLAVGDRRGLRVDEGVFADVAVVADTSDVE